VKMRLRLVLALLFLVALVSASRPARRNGAQRSGSRGTSCKGSSGGRGCRPRTTSQTTQSRPTSISNSSTRRPSTRLPTKRTTSKITASSSTRRPSTRLPTKRTTTRRFPTKRPPNSASTVDEESISDSSTKNKTSAKKYFQNLKTRFQTAAIWFVENKDKSLDEILVERWKEKCSDTASKKEKRKSCVSAALAEGEDDTPEEKLVKDALKSLLEEDSDEVYEFLSSSSSRTFRDIENDGETNDLGDGTDEDCQPQEGNRRNKRDTKKCRWVAKSASDEWGDKILESNKEKIEKVTQNFRTRHVMDNEVFEELYQEDLDKPGIKELLDLFRQGNDVPKNTITKRADLQNLVDEANREEVDGFWQSKEKIRIIQVERKKEGEEYKLTAKKYETHVRFAIDGNGNINHMEGPVPAA